MIDLTGDMSTLVLKKSLNANLGEFSLDSLMLNVLMQIDGVKSLDDIAMQLKMELTALKEVVLRLDRLNLLEVDRSSIPILMDEFFKTLGDELAIAMGPMAEILIEDEIQAMGVSKKCIPVHRGAELVDTLSREIMRDEKRIQFQKEMLKVLKNL